MQIRLLVALALAGACSARAQVPAPATPPAATMPEANDNAAQQSAPAAANGTKKGQPCADRTAFDFWIGHWEVTSGGKVAGHNRIEKAERGCVLVERWQSARGFSGMSTNYVDPATGQWVQLWVDASGGVIELRGGLASGSMVLSGDYTTGKGVRSKLRGTWTPNADGSVRQHFEESKDGGATWKTWFDGTYRKKN